MVFLAEKKNTPSVTAKSVPATTPTVETVSDGEVSILDVPAPSASRAPTCRKAKGKGKAGKATAKSPEELRHIEMENRLERAALDLLQQVREMREWRFATYGDD
jgi:hypothetical protein